jgi:hypothetical protein
MNLSILPLKIIFYTFWLLYALFSIEIFAQNAPITSVGAVSTQGSTIRAAVTVTNFTNIGSCNLKLIYNPAIIDATAVTASSLPGGNLSSNLTVPGEISLGWFTSPAVTLPDNSPVFYLDFTRVAAGSSLLAWVDDGFSCHYSDGNYNNLNDIPQGSYYINGMIITLPGNGIEPYTACKNPLQLTSYPNPFTNHATFTFNTPERGRVTLDILNMLGESVASVANVEFNAGQHSLNFSPDQFKPGIYVAVLKLETNDKLLISTLNVLY